MSDDSFGWQDIENLACELQADNPDKVRFSYLRVGDRKVAVFVQNPDNDAAGEAVDKLLMSANNLFGRSVIDAPSESIQ